MIARSGTAGTGEIMFCSECGKPVPDGSAVCPNCGTRLLEENHSDTEAKAAPAANSYAAAAPTPQNAAPRPRQPREYAANPAPVGGSGGFCAYCGGPVDRGTKRCQRCGKKEKGSGKTAPIVILSVFCALFAAGCVVLFLTGSGRGEQDDGSDKKISSLTAQVEEYEDQLDEKDDEIAALKKRLANAENAGVSQNQGTDSGDSDALREEIASLREEADALRGQADDLRAENSELQEALDALADRSELFDELRIELDSPNVGYGSPDFFAAESVIVMKRTETDRSFHIYGKKNTTYSFNEVGTSADCTWRGGWTGDWALVDIEPTGTGVTVVNFKNEMDSETFKVVIVVTD